MSGPVPPRQRGPEGRESFDCMTTVEVCTLFRVDHKVVLRWTQDEEKFPRGTVFRTPGGHRRYLESAIDKLLARDIDDPTIRKAMIQEAKHKVFVSRNRRWSQDNA